MSPAGLFKNSPTDRTIYKEQMIFSLFNTPWSYTEGGVNDAFVLITFVRISVLSTFYVSDRFFYSSSRRVLYTLGK